MQPIPDNFKCGAFNKAMTAREQVEALVKRRIPAAITRITSGHGPMQVPVNDEDVDIVLADSGKALTTLLSELDVVKAREETYTEFWWLIEGQDGGPLYWKGDVDENPWTRDANKAVRFPDFKSANNVILMYRLNRGNNNEYIRYTHDIKAIEHGFVYGRPAPGGES